MPANQEILKLILGRYGARTVQTSLVLKQEIEAERQLLVATECCHRCKVMLPPCGVTSGKVMLPPSAIQTCHMKRSGLSWHLSPAQQPFEAPRARLRRG
jgi:hypothetical protein